MFPDDLKIKYPFLTEYFEQGIMSETRSIAHSILFYGHDIIAQYDLAQEISRILNCIDFRDKNCQCLNCKWIREKTHPAVLTVSKLDSKPTDDESKTIVSIKQAQMVKNSLLTTSDYHRVYIFCDAQINKETEKWEPLGLNKLNFPEVTANALLKIIEEPPQNTTFFFLCRDKDDLISTIISRSQSFFVPSFEKNKSQISHIEPVFSEYFEFKRQDSFDIAAEILKLINEYGSDTILDEIQNYLSNLLKSNSKNTQIIYKILSDIKLVENAKKMLQAPINTNSVIEDLFLQITSGNN